MVLDQLPPFPAPTYRFIPNFVAWLFAFYGYILGRWPWVVLVIGISTTVVAAAGFYNFQFATESNFLIQQFLEDDNRFVSDDFVIKQWQNESSQANYNNNNQVNRIKRQVSDNQCDYAKYSSTWRLQSVMVVAKQGGIFNEESFNDILNLNSKMRQTLQCLDDFMPVEQRSICCDSWDLKRLKLELSRAGSPAIEAKDLANLFSSLTYPADLRFGRVPTLFANFYGGVTTYELNNAFNSKIMSAKVMTFQYALANLEESLYFERALSEMLNQVKDRYQHFDIYWQTFRQLEDEFLSVVFLEAPKVAATFVCVIIWCVACSLHNDAVSSKPWCGLVGIACSALASMAGFGAMFWQGEYFYTYLIAVPLMALGIGLDDMFILLGNWHRTDVKAPREVRSMLTLMEGGTSIFVTALMTIIDFVIGAYTPYPAIKTYSHYALWCLSFDFWLQMTVFMPILVLTDSCEKAHVHSLCCCCIHVEDEKSAPGMFNL